MGAAAGYIAHEWGDYGYRIEGVESPTHRVSLFHVCASDGSRFTVLADKWGNCQYADTHAYTSSDERASALHDVITKMHEAANPAA